MYSLNASQSTWPVASGIYAMSIGSKMYVGLAAGIHGFKDRWGHHRVELRGNRHGNQHLQNAYNLYGESACSWNVLETISTGDVGHFRSRESHWISHFDTTDQDKGYNVYAYQQSGMATLRHSDQTRTLIAQKATGRVASEETRAKISKSWETRVVSEATRKKASASLKGKKRTPEQKARMSAIQKGVSKSDAHKRSLSEAQKRIAASMGDDHWSAKTYQCLDPAGVLITIKNVNKFAREHGLGRSQLLAVCRGLRRSTKGYRSLTFLDKNQRKRCDLMAPDGSIKECFVIRTFAKEHGLTTSYINRLLKGHISTVKGWKLIKDYAA